jgi:hypothetical protein
MCRYPLVLASPLEEFRLHYAPSVAHFLAQRSGPAELRAASAALGTTGFTVEMRAEDAVLLGDGWADAEGSGRDAFRWAIAKEASVNIPRGTPRDRVIRLRLLPVPRQTVGVSLNGHPLAQLTLVPGWGEYSVNAPAALWREGMNTLTFSFAHATPVASDPRPLAASFDWISIADAGTSPPQSPDRTPIPTIRLGAERFLDANTLWRDRETPIRFPASQLRRDAVEPLLGRLGYDPAAGTVRLDDAIETIAYGSDCEDPGTFLHRAFAVLLERPPSAFEEQDLLTAMRDGWSRPRIAVRIARSEEFRKRTLSR